MQKSNFSTGGFVLHKIRIAGSACKFSAWYDEQGKLIDAERIDSLNRSYNATPPQRESLSKLGKVYK